jgi:cytochrome c-type biogenesis protein CcmF
MRQKMMSGGDFTLGAKLEVKSYGKVFEVEPKFTMSKGNRTPIPAEIKDANVKIELVSLVANQGIVKIAVSPYQTEAQNNNVKREVLAVTASIKPFVGLVWLGTLVVVAGFFIAMLRRLKESRS